MRLATRSLCVTAAGFLILGSFARAAATSANVSRSETILRPSLPTNPDARTWAIRRAAEYGLERDAFYFLVRMTGRHYDHSYRLATDELGDEPEGAPDGLVAALQRSGFRVSENGADNQIMLNISFANRISPTQWIVSLGADIGKRWFYNYYCATRVHGHWNFSQFRGTRRDARSIARVIREEFGRRKGMENNGCWFQSRTATIVDVSTTESEDNDGHTEILVYLKCRHHRWHIVTTYEFAAGV